MIGPPVPPLPNLDKECIYPLSPSSSPSEFYASPISVKPPCPKRSFSYLEDISQPLSPYSQRSPAYSTSEKGFRPSLLRGRSEQPTFNTTWNPSDTSDLISSSFTRVIQRKGELGIDLASPSSAATTQEASPKSHVAPDQENDAQVLKEGSTTGTGSPSVPILNRPARPKRSRLPQSSGKQEQASSTVNAWVTTGNKVDASVQTDPTSVTRSLSREPSSRPKESFFPPTPPISSEILPPTGEKACICRFPSTQKTKRRKRQRTATESTLHNTPVPMLTPSNDLLDITDLEEAGDNSKAFEKLLAIYKQQKYLRDAEEDLNQQKIADLTAGIISHKMENLRLVEMLHSKGISLQEIQEGATVPHELYFSPREPPVESSDIHNTKLDISRFTMLRKVDQLGRMRQSHWPPNDVESPRPRRWTNDMTLSGEKGDDTRPEEGQSRRNSGMQNPSTPLDSSQPTIAEAQHPDPYSHANDIDQKMKSLEMEFISSQSRGSSLPTLSINASPPTMVHSRSMNSRNIEVGISGPVLECDRGSPNPSPIIEQGDLSSGFLQHKPVPSFSSTAEFEYQTDFITQDGLNAGRSTSHLRTRSESDIEHLLSRATDSSKNSHGDTGMYTGNSYSPASRLAAKRSVDLGFVSFAMDNSWGSLLGELMHYTGEELQEPVTHDFGRGLGLHQR
ncbi:hypothetical protein CPB86DRAFT_797113 [Serendipita vermifera]|nr:hypothetical protein CPB86DRAFT_797113 [Serendipita vermifera]